MSNKRILVCLIVCMMVASTVPILLGPVGADGTTSRAPDSNTDFASAVTIVGDDVYYGSELTGLDDTLDYFKIELNNTGSGAQKLIVNATAGGNGAIKLNVYDPDTYWIATDTTLGLTSYLEVIVEWSGWYYVSIEGQGQTFSYNMRFQKVAVPWTGDTNTDAANATVVGTFPYEIADISYDNVTDPHDFYKVHLENVPGDHVDILMVKVTPPEGAGTLIIPEMYYANNNTGIKGMFITKGASWINPPAGYIFTYAPESTGDFLVRIWGPDGADTYDVKMKKVTADEDTNNDPASAEAILTTGHSDSKSGTAAQDIDEFDYYSFSGKVNMHFNATMESLDYDVDMALPTMYLSIQNSTGYEFVEADLDVFVYSCLPFAYLEGDLPENDTYYLIVQILNGAGNYDLDLTVNTPPQVVADYLDESYSMFIWENGENASLNLDEIWEDFDGDPMTYSTDAASNPNMDVTIYPNNTMLFKPTQDWTGITCINLTANDDQGGSGTHEVCARVYNINHEPTIKKHFNETYTNGVLGMKFQEVKSDLDLTDYFEDIDTQDSHWFSVTGNDKVYISFGEEVPITPEHYHTGIVTIIAPKEELTESVQFTSKDNGWPNKVSEPLNLTIQVSSGEIKVLTKSAGQLTIEEDSSGEFPVKEYIFFKPPPPPDDNLTFTEGSSDNLDITITNGIANITPKPDWCGSEIVTFTGKGQKNDVSNKTDLKVVVTCINDAPVINSHSPDGPQTLAEGGYLVFEVNATDVDTGADLMKYKWLVDGKIVPSLLNYHNYTPGFTDSGTHNITVEVNDSEIMILYTWDTVVVTEVNRAPVGVKIAEPEVNATFKKGKEVSLKAATASDPDGDPLNYTWYDGTEQLGQNKTLDVKFKKKGAHEIKLVVDDGRGGETVDTVIIKVKEEAQNGPGFEALVLFIAVISALAILSRRRYSKD